MTEEVEDPPEVTAKRQERERLGALVAAVRGGERLMPQELVRLERVRVLLGARGIALGDPRAALWLAPVICTSPSEQERFLREYARVFELETGELGLPPVKTVVTPPPPPLSWWRRERLPLLCAAAAVVLVSAGIWWSTRDHRDPAADTGTLFEMVKVVTGAVPAGAPPVGIRPWLGIATVAVLVFALLRGWRRLSRARASAPGQGFRPSHIDARPLALEDALPRLYAAPALRRRLAGLRRHRALPSTKIHVRHSIRSTIRAGGRPVLVRGTRPVTPDYVLLTERESPRDHLPVVAQALAARFAGEGVMTSAYEYFADPRRLRRSFPAEETGEVSLDRVFGRHPLARVLIFAEPADCLEPNGRAAGWIEALAEERPVLFNPRPQASWDWREEHLEDAGVTVFSGLPEGIGAYADRLQSRGEDLPSTRGRSGGGSDFAAVLDRNAEALVSDAEPEPGEAEALVDELELWLGGDAMILVRAAAVFPLMEPPLTLLLASRLHDRTGAALLTEERLVAVSRLPWMRVGRMPLWLRRPLVQGLTAEQLATAVRVVHAYINPIAEGPGGRARLDLGQADDPVERERLLRWLRQHPNSDYGDPLLIDAVAGRPPEELGADEADDGLAAAARRIRKAVDMPRDVAAVAVSAVVAVALAVIVPAQPTPPSPTPVRTFEEGARPDVVQADTDPAAENLTTPESADDSADPSRRSNATGAAKAKGMETAQNVADADFGNASVMPEMPAIDNDQIVANALSAQACVLRDSDSADCLAGGGTEVLAEIQIYKTDNLERLTLALREIGRSLKPDEGESLDVVVLVKSTRPGSELDGQALMVEAYAGKSLSAWVPQGGTYAVRRAVQQSPRGPDLSVRIVKVRLAERASE